MKFMDKELKDLIVKLPFADGTEGDFGVFAYFEVTGKNYFALLPIGEDGKMDDSQSYMLYRVEMDAANNPEVIYIEDDLEYALVARFFADNYLKQN